MSYLLSSTLAIFCSKFIEELQPLLFLQHIAVAVYDTHAVFSYYMTLSNLGIILRMSEIVYRPASCKGVESISYSIILNAVFTKVNKELIELNWVLYSVRKIIIILYASIRLILACYSTMCRSSYFQKSEKEMPLGEGTKFSEPLLEFITSFPLMLSSNNLQHYYLITLQIHLTLSKP